jgi:hypothetical protein
LYTVCESTEQHFFATRQFAVLVLAGHLIPSDFCATLFDSASQHCEQHCVPSSHVSNLWLLNATSFEPTLLQLKFGRWLSGGAGESGLQQPDPSSGAGTSVAGTDFSEPHTHPFTVSVLAQVAFDVTSGLNASVCLPASIAM